MTILQIPPHVGWKILDDTTVVVSMQGGAFYKFDGSSKFIWDCIVKNLSPEQIVKSLVNHYRIDSDVASKDFDSFINELVLDELIVRQ